MLQRSKTMCGDSLRFDSYGMKKKISMYKDSYLMQASQTNGKFTHI